MSPSGISPEAARLIAYLKSVGFGWAKFAESVERSGRCSPRQLETLRSMEQRVRTHTPARAKPVELSPLEQLEVERQRVRELEREQEQARIDQLMREIYGEDDRHIGPP